MLHADLECDLNHQRQGPAPTGYGLNDLEPGLFLPGDYDRFRLGSALEVYDPNHWRQPSDVDQSREKTTFLGTRGCECKCTYCENSDSDQQAKNFHGMTPVVIRD